MVERNREKERQSSVVRNSLICTEGGTKLGRTHFEGVFRRFLLMEIWIYNFLLIKKEFKTFFKNMQWDPLGEFFFKTFMFLGVSDHYLSIQKKYLGDTWPMGKFCFSKNANWTFFSSIQQLEVGQKYVQSGYGITNRRRKKIKGSNAPSLHKYRLELDISQRTCSQNDCAICCMRSMACNFIHCGYG